ncbi:hypothetical protein NQ317_015640 [Molorchus minor]|uniref:Retrotransposon gag domain-containing protein n=1 Tax=Molorchus minor TaxID=1323400 RepID=A0ABQ9JT38_9CUCU|nr:hypothetical protein NQ317_015640 [Molorchus minor]
MASEKGMVGHLRDLDVNQNDWSIFKPRLTNYFEANGIADEGKKRAIFLNLLAEESYRLIFNLSLPKLPEERRFSELLHLFNECFVSKKSVFAERFKFYNSFKTPSESVNEWAARVRSLAATCEFKAELDACLRDRFIMGIEKCDVKKGAIYRYAH